MKKINVNQLLRTYNGLPITQQGDGTPPVPLKQLLEEACVECRLPQYLETASGVAQLHNLLKRIHNAPAGIVELSDQELIDLREMVVQQFRVAVSGPILDALDAEEPPE